MKAPVILMLLAGGLATTGCNAVTAANERSTASVPAMLELDFLPAFPGAEGYGARTRGGRGGRVIAVTNLNDSGSGSLRAAVEAEGPRMVVFRVAGTIELNSELSVRHPYITIAGQSAPGDGITIKGHLGIDADEVIVRYIRVRTDGRFGDGDAITARNQRNLILDHVSTSWGTDEVLSVYGNSYVTIQNSVISEAIGNGETHKFGGIWGNDHGTYHHNLFAHNAARNPRFTSGIQADFRNNVLYNWEYNTVHGGHRENPGNPEAPSTQVNIVANYYKPGPATRSAVSRIVQPMTRGGADDAGQFWVSDNLVEGTPEVTADNWRGVEPSGGVELSAFQLAEPWPAMPIAQQSAEEAYETVLARVGASLRRDAVDARIIEEVRTGTATYGDNGIISSPSDVGGWPELQSAPAPDDTSGNGIPDWWLQKYGLDIQNPDVANQDLNGTGYTNIEEYLNGTDPTVFVDYRNPENNVNTLTADSFGTPHGR
jgi:hypothetical protein